MRSSRLLGLCLLLGCAHDPGLVPAPEAKTTVQDPHTAIALVAGVQIRVNGDAWRDRPHDLERFATPILVRVDNNSGRLLRLRYSEFRLEGPDGMARVALPPHALGGKYSALEPSFLYDGFFIAPHYASYYGPSISPWSGPFVYDPIYYHRYYGAWIDPLPSRAMQRKALPEGVLAVEGSIEGFVYFQELPRGVPRVTLRFDLVDAESEEKFGAIEIPFVPKDRDRYEPVGRAGEWQLRWSEAIRPVQTAPRT